MLLLPPWDGVGLLYVHHHSPLSVIFRVWTPTHTATWLPVLAGGRRRTLTSRSPGTARWHGTPSVLAAHRDGTLDSLLRPLYYPCTSCLIRLYGPFSASSTLSALPSTYPALRAWDPPPPRPGACRRRWRDLGVGTMPPTATDPSPPPSRKSWFPLAERTPPWRRICSTLRLALRPAIWHVVQPSPLVMVPSR